MDEREELQGTEYERKFYIYSRRKKKTVPCVISLMWNLKYVTIEPIYETDIASQMWKQTCDCQGGGGWGSRGNLMDKQ